jgi:hypothetical protein
MRTFIYFVILTLCAVLLESCTLFNKKTIDEPPVTDSIEQCDYVPVPTVYDVLEQREELKYALWCDSVYLTMPEQILTHMLVTKGTTISIQEIVEDYISNKQFYHDTILNTMNIQKKYLPDSIPKNSHPNSFKKAIDSLQTH